MTITDTTTKIRPGKIVAVKSRIEGGVSYLRTDLSADGVKPAGESAEVSKWETTKIVEDAQEHKRASAAVSKARTLISSVCIKSTFGLICPSERAEDLKNAVREARAVVAEYNASATFTRAHLHVLQGEIATSDEESVRAIGEEVSQLIAQMNTGIDKLDVQAIRDAADKAKQLEAMLGKEQAEAVKGAVEQARRAARTIVKRVQKDSEAAEIVLKDIQRGSLAKARIAFLDFEGAAQPEVVQPVANVNAARLGGLDLGSAESSDEVQ